MYECIALVSVSPGFRSISGRHSFILYLTRLPDREEEVERKPRQEAECQLKYLVEEVVVFALQDGFEASDSEDK